MLMKNIIVLMMAVAVFSWSIPKPMESITNYNVMMVHGAYGLYNDDGELQGFEPGAYPQSIEASSRLGAATMGGYTSDSRVTKWISHRILGEPEWEKDSSYLRNSYVYNWRAFSNTRNSSMNNAFELGGRTWNKNGQFGSRRALIEEAQEVKAKIYTQRKIGDSVVVDSTIGQSALEIIRKNPDLYRQLASRYILVGHSMGGIVSREYVHSNFYNDDVDKIITLDSPHEGTGALNMQLAMVDLLDKGIKSATQTLTVGGLTGLALVASKSLTMSQFGTYLLASLAGIGGLNLFNWVSDFIVSIKLEDYDKKDSLVCYVDPHARKKDECKDVRNITDLLSVNYDADKMPMFRLLAGENSMTFTDPSLGWQGVSGFLIPEALTAAMANLYSQFKGSESFSATTVNSITGLGLGFLGGIYLRGNGTSLVETPIGLARNTPSLNDGGVDVRRNTFNAAYNATEGFLSYWNAIFGAYNVAVVLTNFIPSEAASAAARLALGVSTAALLSTYYLSNLTTGIIDLSESHNYPIKERFKDWRVGGYNGYVDSIHVYEDFLYERPFVNLALNDSRTMGMLANDPKLNPNCYFESDSLQKIPLCEVGLYGSRDSVVIDPVTMKETHIYNAAVAKTDSAGNVIRDSSGNVVYDSVYYGTFEQRDYVGFRKSPLKFKSESDWYKVGVKVDRWERVPGLKPNGNVDSTYVPIRHVERYNVPDIVVTGFIEKYSFVVDDLMPHRMRQIKMTFNSNEEVAWECDISKAEDDQHACAVYKRKLGNSWGNPDTTIGDKGYVAHPIKKNGRFDFNARTYFGNLADIQKDNQNTVMISMVNKIGLSNTQRFYYLFKATDNMLKPKWPEHDVVLNEINGFKAYVSALDYQGFRVHGASDAFFRDSLGNDVQTYSTQVMDTAIVIGNNNSEYVFVSKQNDSKPAEGKYRWVVSTNISNKELKSSSEPDSSKTDSYEVHFKVDRTAPAFTLTSDAMMNPDSSMFITRFKWVGKDSADRAHGSDIRAMRWTLEKATGQSSGGSATSFTKYAELPALYDVASNEFAIAWDRVPQDKRNAMDDGLYRVAAYAIDYAVPNESAYHAMNDLVDKIFTDPANVSETEWTNIKSLGLNDTMIYAEFRVDHTAPQFESRETKAVTAADTVNNGTSVNLSGKFDVLRANCPARDADWTYVSADSLLRIDYVVKESLNGLDSAAVTIGWNFVHLPDTNVIDRAGDSVWVFKSLNGRASGSWTEMAGFRMADGEYSVRAILRDEAKNVRHDVVPKRVRVDRTAPQIVGLTSDHLVYMDKDGDFSATILVSEKADIGVNRTGMHCSYRVLGGADSSWREIRKGERKLLANDTVNFTIAKSSVDTARGIRYLEAACVDAAGNVSVRTDLFHVGARFPQITYPQADSIQSDQNYIPIVGIAPKTSSADSLSSVYRLRYRVGNDTTWKTDKIKVVAANRSTSADNISRISQSTEGVLGYLENDNFGNEALVYVELAVASCETCNDWAAVTTNVVVIPPDSINGKPTVELAVTRNGTDVSTFKVDDGPVDISVRLKNKFNSNYMLRVYAEDSKHRGIFDASVEKVFYNPYYGTPTAAVDTAIWFFEKDGKYYLKWKNLDKINLKVGYNSAKFGETCVDSTGNTAIGCSTEHAPVNFSAVLDAAKAYLADYPEWMPPAYIDSAMTISNASGEIVMEAEDAFRVYVERKDFQDTSALKVPVYFGEGDKAGFYWITGADTTVSPLMTGWTVNPNAYGLNYRWNGIATSGAYPSGEITLYAEVTENILDNPYVNVVEKKLRVEQKEIELVVPKSLPDYVLLRNADSNASTGDSSETPVYELNAMKVYFGLKNGDARVQVSVLSSSASVMIFDDTLKAHSGDSAYSVIWLGTDSSGIPLLAEGKCYLKFEALLPGSNSVVVSETIPFEYRLGSAMNDVTPKDSSVSSFYVAEAKKKVDGRYVYEPYADYLVTANMSGWYLPDTLRYRAYNVNGTVSGTQKILGFRPERFSLGIKRHRDTLEMVIFRLVHSNTKIIDCHKGWSWGEGDNCDNPSDVHDDIRPVDTVKFWESKRFFEDVDIVHYADAGFYNPSGDSTYIDIIACTMRTWKVYNTEKKRNPNTTLSKSEFEELKSKCEWKLENLTGRERFQFEMPSVETNPLGVQNVKMFSDDSSVGCSVVMNGGYMDSICSSDNEKYDPNKRLFNVRFVTPSNGWFFTDYNKINENESNKYWQNIHYEYHLEIPNVYWNAPFGMDNLVNRTIRFDHTNSTIFNENNDDGYWNAVKGNGRNYSNAINSGATNYFDGNKWNFNQKYGLLTPFEVQRLIFYPVNVFPYGSNVFRFDDESEDFMYSSSFELKFYGPDTSTHHFVAKVVGNPVYPDSVPESECNPDLAEFVELMTDTALHRPCQIVLTSIANDSVKTPVFKHGNVFFYVGMNRLWSDADKDSGTVIPYPADSATWRDSVKDSCPENKTWKDYKEFAAEGKQEKACYKYYGSGSRVHFFFKDYNDSAWKNNFLADSMHYFRNYVNSSRNYIFPKKVDSALAYQRTALGNKDFSLSYRINPENFSVDGIGDSALGRFFIPLDSLKKIKEEYAGAGIDIQHVKVDSLILGSDAVYDTSAMRLYVKAHRWDDLVAYRRSNDTAKTVLEHSSENLSLRDIYVYRANPDANSCDKALYCVADMAYPNSLVRNPWIKDPVVESASIWQVDFSPHPFLEISGGRDSLDRVVVLNGSVMNRPPEIVEIRGKLTPGQAYSLSYLNDTTYYSISDTLTVDSGCAKYPDGSCHLAWFDMNRLQGHTQFLLTWGENGSVNPTNAMRFSVYVGSNVKPQNNGVVKSMFGDLSVTFPQGSLEKAEDITVRTVNVQKDYGFGVFKDMALTGPVMEVLPSMTFTDTNNLPRIQMKISKKEIEDMNVTPRTLRLYKVDFDNKQFVPLEDALYGFLDGQGAPIMSHNGTDTLKCNGKTDVDTRCANKDSFDWEYVLISAQTRTFSVFVAMDTLSAVFPDSTQEEELPAQFACHVPSDSLWMGIDNGYLAYGASCNHPGHGTVSLYRGNSLVAEASGEIPDTIKYNGKRLIGGSVVGSVPYGRYESRYVGRSVLGLDMQISGPVVRTDSARPVISAFEVLGGEDVLDRIFTVHANVNDVESGIASVVVSSKLGNTLRSPLVLQPDSLGNVMGEIRLTRNELAKCSGCKLSLEMRVEDYGHNHVERTFESGKLYQYPAELALWYPSREGIGNAVHEHVGTGHNLVLDSVASPWLSDAGLYFSMPVDRAAGAGPVNLGTSASYSFETRIKVGYANGAGWHRVLGFKGVGGLEMELLVHGRKLQLSEGVRAWSTEHNVLPVEKEWAHVVVTVDSSEVNFYVNGELVKSAPAEPMERELDGVFSAGAGDGSSFVGNLADMRMYKKALSGGEVFALSQPVTDDKNTEPEIVEIVTVPMATVDGGNGFEPEFSCSVAGNRYFESDRDGARLAMEAFIEKAATYKVLMFVRSATLASANVSVLPSPGMGYAGSVPLTPVWRTAMVSDISMNLSAGMHTITLEAPAGLQVAGFALVTDNVPPSSIAWNSGMENSERKIKTYVRYEGFNDKKILQPRVRLTNVSGSSVHGYSVRYYFRGEVSSMTRVHAYYPYDTTGLAVHSESGRTGYVEWKFENGWIPAHGTVFNGNGPHFGVHYEDWTPWNPYDDPSFVENAAAGFVEDDGVVVLDADKRLIGGSCVEMEDSVSAEVKARVYAAENRSDDQASEIQLKVENVGNVTLRNYDVRYYFFLEAGVAPLLDVYSLPTGVMANLENVGDGRWQVSLHAAEPLVSGKSWKNNAQFALHCENWANIWNSSDDPSSVGLGAGMVEAVGISVFDSLGNRIYGDVPVWPEFAGADSSHVPDYGLKPKDNGIPVHRVDGGLVVQTSQYTYVSLSLVNAAGAPVRNLYSGTLAPGNQFVAVNWSGIDLNRTYLMLRVNGSIKSTKLLSLL